MGTRQIIVPASTVGVVRRVGRVDIRIFQGIGIEPRPGRIGGRWIVIQLVVLRIAQSPQAIARVRRFIRCIIIFVATLVRHDPRLDVIAVDVFTFRSILAGIDGVIGQDIRLHTAGRVVKQDHNIWYGGHR